MAIAAVAARGTGIGNTSSNVMNLTVTGTIVVGRTLLLAVTTNNVVTTDGQTNTHKTVTDTSGNTWTKLGEYTNGEGVSADGVTTSVWKCDVTAQLTSGVSVVTHSTDPSPTVDKAMSLYEFSTGTGTLVVEGSSNFVATDAANDFGSSALSGFTSGERLWFRGMGKEANTATALTPTSGFTAITNVRSRNNALAMALYGEFKIANSTGETSNPTLAVAGDTASVFLALVEALPTNRHQSMFSST